MTTQVSAADDRQSRVGKRPIDVPKGVKVSFAGDRCNVEGPKGKLSLKLPDTISATQDGSVLVVKSNAGGADGRRLQGLARALLANTLKGAAEGYERILELHGTGYRAEIKGTNSLVLSLGFSHQINYKLPPSVKASIPGDSKGAVLILQSPDKAELGQASATIRSFRPPEPYGGKGVRYRDEQVRRKAGKSGKK
ncbi:MAG TPA: 50S ribosomal protein L6 [Polyangiaceae bacterium]|jgi:large subunit ribosomal protein L6|nr:50S ribosomal protein L6 [Polyangiaceae bacterium]